MKNEEKGDSPEEKKLVWKFKDLPTAGEVAELVDTEVITPQEARAILFKEEVKQSDEVEALKEMVNTLQEMVKDLLSRPNVQLVPYTKIVEVPARTVPYWDRYWAGTTTTGGTLGSVINTTAIGGSGSTTYTMSTKQ